MRPGFTRVCGILVGLAACGCVDGGGRPAPRGDVVLLNDHGVKIGDAIARVNAPCSDGKIRQVGDTAIQQVVTLTSADDYCSECDRHLSGLDEAWRHVEIKSEHIYLTYASKARQVEVLKAYHAKTGAPICFDEAGVIWQTNRITHTPVTLLLQHGRVVYAHDAPLDDSLRRASFVRDVSRMATP
jgi:hypothetical protein